MEINATIQKVLKALGTIALIILAALPLYYNRTKSTALEIKKINEVELTRPLNVDRLISSYLYDSIPVEHLWQVSLLIKNTGENTLFGDGFENKNIRGKALKLHTCNCDKLLAIDITDNTTDAVLKGDSLQFTQWRPGEYIELMLLSDGPLAPGIVINDRDILNATISYVTYSPEEQLVPKKLMDKLPKGLSKALWWLVLVGEIISVLIFILACAMQVINAETKGEKKTNLLVFIWILLAILLPIIWMF